MITHRADRHLAAIALAKECAALGARVRTISAVSGLHPREVQLMFFRDQQQTPRGRSPDSPDWYHSANLPQRIEASVAMALYRRLREAGCGPAGSLVTAYEHYARLYGTGPRISFDRAFDLAAHTDGLWHTRSPSFSLVNCDRCGSEFLAPYGSAPHSGEACPFCKLVRRFGTDPRLRAAFCRPQAPGTESRRSEIHQAQAKQYAGPG